jgi:DNA polymerase-4
VLIPAHFELYEFFSGQILDLCQQKTPLVEPCRIGAGFLDLTGATTIHGDSANLTRDLQSTIARWLRIPISTGLAATKSVAGIAARLRKPNGRACIPAGQEAQFLSPLPLRWLPGLHPNTLSLLQVAGLARIGDIAHAPLDALELILGKSALPLQRLSQGIDHDPVRPAARQSQPAWMEQIDFTEDVWEQPKLLLALRTMLEKAMAAIRQRQCEARKLTIGIVYTDREEAQRSFSLDFPTSVETDFLPHLDGLLRAVWQRRVRLRGLRLNLANLYPPSPQLNLFAPPPRRSPVQLALAVDALRRRFGPSAVIRGYQLPHELRITA